MSVQRAVSDSCCIETELKDVLTPQSGVTLISELIKFILYRKEQLPYTFDRLKYVVTKRNSRDTQKTAPNNLSASVEHQFNLASDGLRLLESVFEHIGYELALHKMEIVTEVVLLFGSTPMTPRQVYWIIFPKFCFLHSPEKHPSNYRKHLMHLLRSVIVSNDLNKMLKEPMNPTNVFFFLKKTFQSSGLANAGIPWFTPKNRFEIPQTGQHIYIKFKLPKKPELCFCQNFSSVMNHNEYLTRECWYQAPKEFKGFTDVYINGVSVADLWLK